MTWLPFNYKKLQDCGELIKCSFRLLSLEVSSLEDVYWLEDSQASKVLGKDADAWSKVRQKLPTSKTQLETMKADLWSTIVKSSQHQDAWANAPGAFAWGDVLVVSMSFAGLITLVIHTQKSDVIFQVIQNAFRCHSNSIGITRMTFAPQFGFCRWFLCVFILVIEIIRRP